MSGRLIGIIPARGWSQGIPGKNLKLLAGHPLLFWTLYPAGAVCDVVIVSSDSDEILKVCNERAGWAFKTRHVLLHRRSAMLATARTPDLPVVLDAYRQIDQEPDDVILLLRPTAPFRRPEEIRQVAALLRENLSDSVRSVVPARDPPQKAYLEVGWARPAETAPRPGWPLLEPATGPRHRANHPRQWLPRAWRACGFIDAVRADVLVGMDSLEGDVILGWPAPPERACDLDTPEQWEAAERLARERVWKPGEVS